VSVQEEDYLLEWLDSYKQQLDEAEADARRG